jgi:hypothetical protein
MAIKKIASLCALVFMSAGVRINSQETKFGWSFGNFGWSYNFRGKHDIAEASILEFNLSFEKMNLMLGASILYGTNKNNRSETEPFYNSFLPLEATYSPFKWKYARLSVYGRGGWELAYTGDVENSDQISEGFFGSLGVKAGLIPLESNFFKYRSYVVTIFSEYTTRNEFKVGASIDLFVIVYIGLKLWSQEKPAEATR